MRKRIASSPRTQGNKKAAPARKALLTGLIVCVAVCAMAIYTGQVLRRLSYFKVKDVVIKESFSISDPVQALVPPPEGSVDLSYLKGRNIFTLDLAQEARRVQAAYPQYRRVRLVKVFPNQLFVHCLKRRAIAIVGLPRYFYVGEDLALAPVPASLKDLDLPVITGLEKRIARVQPGKKYFLPELMFAVGIVRQMRTNSILRNFSLKKIDVSNIENTSVFVLLPFVVEAVNAHQDPDAGWLEVKLGQDNIRAKVSLLGELFFHYRQNLSLLKYIDLRFKEPVIKLKDEKK